MRFPALPRFPVPRLGSPCSLRVLNTPQNDVNLWTCNEFWFVGNIVPMVDNRNEFLVLMVVGMCCSAWAVPLDASGFEPRAFTPMDWSDCGTPPPRT